MDTSKADDLSLQHWGTRFSNKATESAYGQWRNEGNLSTLRLTGWVSVIAWVTAPLGGFLMQPDINWLEVFRLGYLIAVPAMLLAVLITYSPVSRYATLVSACSLATVSTLMNWIQFREAAPFFPGMSFAGPMVASTLVMCSFGLFMRLTPRLAALALLPGICSVVWIIWWEYRQGLIEQIYLYPYLVNLQVVYFFVATMSWFGEKQIRQNLISELLLHRHQDVIQRYAPPAVIRHIQAGKHQELAHPQRRRATMLFVDICGFTDVADRVEPEVMTEVLSEYLSAMADLVEQHQGTLNEFAGDGFMALFGAPEALPPEDQAVNALRCAMAMQAKMQDLNAGWSKLGLGQALQIRAGINTGMVSVGNYGSQGRVTYTAIGLQTNIAARIESTAEPGKVLLSETTYQLAKDHIRCEPQGNISCKGVHFPVAVFSPAVAPP